MINNFSSIINLTKFNGRLVGPGASILLGLGMFIALARPSLSQTAPSTTQIPLAGGARDVPPGGGRFIAPTDPYAIERIAEMRKSLDKLTPVTNEMLRNPSPNDWLMWRRTYDSWGYSPLNQINRDNAKNLTVAWTFGLSSTGVYEFTPIVHDGIMFVWSHGENIQALDAENGNLLWSDPSPSVGIRSFSPRRTCISSLSI